SNTAKKEKEKDTKAGAATPATTGTSRQQQHRKRLQRAAQAWSGSTRTLASITSAARAGMEEQKKANTWRKRMPLRLAITQQRRNERDLSAATTSFLRFPPKRAQTI